MGDTQAVQTAGRGAHGAACREPEGRGARVGTGRAISCHSQVPCLLRGVCHPHALPGWRCGRRRGIGVSPAPAGPLWTPVRRQRAAADGGTAYRGRQCLGPRGPRDHLRRYLWEPCSLQPPAPAHGPCLWDSPLGLHLLPGGLRLDEMVNVT